MIANNHTDAALRAAVQADALVKIDCARLSSKTGLPLALDKFLGRSALQRNLLQLTRHGVKYCIVAVNDSQALAAQTTLFERQLQEIDAENTTCRFAAPDTLKSTHAAVWRRQVVVVDANSVFDDRLFDLVVSSPVPSKVIANADGEAIGLCKLHRDELHRVLQGDAETLSARIADLPGLRALGTDSVPHYLAGMRRVFPPYWHALNTCDDLQTAAHKVLDAAQKGILDFPARYLHPVPENILTRLAAATSITPNQITVLSAVLAFLGTYLFATQSFAFALVLAIVAGILDGVDGKLARVKLLSSPFGDRLDHTLDVSFEFSWYLAIAWGLSRGYDDPSLFGMGFFMIGVMLAARALSGTYQYLTGHQIHDHTAFDRTARLFAGRRNIYVLILLAGYLLGDLLSSFYVVIAWGLTTVSLYLTRNMVAIMQKYAGVQPR